ncbi:MAG: Lrp/AsnC ligand binding domain-containing protein [Nitrososphaerales archaeon]
MKAYVEIHIDPGSDVEKIAENIRKSEGVKEACRVVGRADILVTVEGRDLKQVSDIALQRISSVRGVSVSHTLVCVDSESVPKPAATDSSPSSEQVPAISFS